MKKKVGTHWRRVTPYLCRICGKKRFTFVFQRATEGTCRSCERNQPHKDQVSLFSNREADGKDDQSVGTPKRKVSKK